MGKKKPTKKQTRCLAVEDNHAINALLKREDIQDLITNAILAVDDRKKQREQEENEKARLSVRKILKIKEKPGANVIVRGWYTLRNLLSVIFRLPFCRMTDIKGKRMTVGAIKAVLYLFWAALYAVLLVSAFSIFVAAIMILIDYSYCFGSFSEWAKFAVLPAMAILCMILAGFCKILSAEIDNIDDTTLLIGIVNMVFTLVSAVAATITVIVTIKYY